MAIDPRLLRSFVVLAEELHFGRAAQRLHIAQSGLSVQIRRLEQQVGSPLYRRSSRVVELTEGGRAMLGPARAAILAAEQAERAAREAARAGAHPLRLGVDHWLEDVIPTLECYALEHPEITMRVPRMDETQAQAMLVADQIDAFVGFARTSGAGDHAQVPFMDVPLHAKVGLGDPLAACTSVSLAAFRESPFACVSRGVEPGCFDSLVDVLSEGEGAEALCLLEIESTGAASDMEIAMAIAAGRAVGVSTPAAIAAGPWDFRFIPFDPPILLPSFITWPADRSRVLDAFVEDITAFAPGRTPV